MWMNLELGFRLVVPFSPYDGRASSLIACRNGSRQVSWSGLSCFVSLPACLGEDELSCVELLSQLDLLPGLPRLSAIRLLLASLLAASTYLRFPSLALGACLNSLRAVELLHNNNNKPRDRNDAKSAMQQLQRFARRRAWKQHVCPARQLTANRAVVEHGSWVPHRYGSAMAPP